MSDQKQMRRNLLFNTVGNLIFFACQYLTNLLVVWLGGYEDAGLLSTAMTIASAALSFACYGMRTFQVSDLSGKYSDRTYVQSRIATLSIAFVAAAVFAFANSYSPLQKYIILAYTGYRLIEADVDVWHGFLQRAERMDLVGVSFGIRGLLSAVSFVAGLVLLQNLLLTILIMLATNLLYAAFVDRHQGRTYADFQKTGSAGVFALLWECAPLALYSFLNVLVSSVPKYFCERLLGTVQMGYFNSIFAPAAIIQVGATYLFVPFITTFARLWNEKDGKGFRKAVTLAAAFLAALLLLGFAGVAVAGRWGLSVLYYGKPEILAYTSLLYPLIGCTVLTTGVLIECHLLTIMREMKGLIVGNIAGIAVSLAISHPLTVSFGVYGTAFATMAALIVQMIVLGLFMLLRSHRQFGAK